jgi:hypothetical protein
MSTRARRSAARLTVKLMDDPLDVTCRWNLNNHHIFRALQSRRA